MIELYNYYRSSASFRVRIALNLKGIDYKAIPIHLINNDGEHLSEDYTTLNPHQLVPVFKDNNKIINQSLAIIEYIDETYPYPPLLPQDSYTKAKVRAFSLAIAADLHPLNNLRVLKYLTHKINMTEDQKKEWYQHWIHTVFSALEKQLSNHSYHYCFGDEPGLADIVLVPQMYNARRFSCDMNQYPTLMKIDTCCQNHPAFKQAWPTDA